MPPLVLVPGLMCDAGMFAGVLPTLSRSRAVVIADVSRDDSMTGMADRLLGQVAGRFDLLGFSMGGMVALEVLARAPARVRRLALFDTNASSDPPDAAAWRQSCINRAQDGNMMDLMRKEIVPRYFDPDRPAADIAQACLDTAAEIGASVFVRQFTALAARADHHHTLRNFDGSALIARGTADQLCNREAHLRMIDALPTARFVEIEGAAHLSIQQRPREVANVLLDWLGD